MKVNRLYICNNPYQVIVAILIAKQLHKDGDYRSIMLTDNFNDSKKVAENLENNSFFNKVYFCRINKILFPQKKLDKCKKVVLGILDETFINRAMKKEALDLGEYDEIYYNNDDLFLYSLISYCLKRNPQIEVFRFEEGYSSYIRPFCSMRAQAIFNKRHKNITFPQILSGMYYFFPESVLFKTSTPLKKIKKIISDEVKVLIKCVFPGAEKFRDIEGKWIIFEESFFRDFGYNADMVLYEDIIKEIGPEKVVVKIHPRSVVNRFKNLGVRVLENTGIPWEAILLLNNYKNVKFVTLASGSVINARLLLDDSTVSFLLYRCIDPAIPALEGNFEKFIDKFAEKHGEELYIPSNITDFFSIRENI